MEVAVAGVEDVGHAEAVTRRHLGDAGQHMRKLAPRDRAVHAEIVRRDPTNRRKRRLASGPDSQPLVLARGSADGRRAPRLRQALHLRRQFGALRLRPVQLDDQQGRAVHGIADPDERLGGADGGVVHHLHARRNDARGAVGGRRHNAAASGGLFVHGKGVNVDPVQHRQRVGQRTLGAFAQLGCQHWGAS